MKKKTRNNNAYKEKSEKNWENAEGWRNNIGVAQTRMLTLSIGYTTVNNKAVCTTNKFLKWSWK